MAKKIQSDRLTKQHKKSKGVIGIFGEEAQMHDVSVKNISKLALKKLKEKYKKLEFRYRDSISKKEINI